MLGWQSTELEGTHVPDDFLQLLYQPQTVYLWASFMYQRKTNCLVQAIDTLVFGFVFSVQLNIILTDIIVHFVKYLMNNNDEHILLHAFFVPISVRDPLHACVLLILMAEQTLYLGLQGTEMFSDLPKVTQ